MKPTIRLSVGAILLSIISIFSTIPFTAYAAVEDTYFIATAYYSPLPGQDRYTTGSYVGDKRLNGSGKITASGKEVFEGLIAAPKNYPFGTKIYFEGYGIGEVADRGGAIVKAGQRGHEYDRVDIWMGYGDEGLTRALNWGTRTIKGKIVVPSSPVSLKLGESPLGNYQNLRVTPLSSEEEIKKLQQIFTKANLYTGEIDGKYASIQDELIGFQIKQGIISDAQDEAAGYFGPKTVAALRREYSGNTEEILKKEEISLFEEFNHSMASEKYKIILEYGDLQVGPDSDADTITSLQYMLREIGEYDGKIDGIYENVVGDLIALQLRIGLIDSPDDWGAGYFGNKTKTALWKYYEEENDKILNTGLVLSQSEKKKIRDGLEFIEKKLEREEKRGGKPAKQRLESLKKQILNALPSVNDTQLKLKLEYLYSIL